MTYCLYTPPTLAVCSVAATTYVTSMMCGLSWAWPEAETVTVAV